MDYAHANTFDPADRKVRSDAQDLAERLDGDSPVELAVRVMLDDVAHGARVIVLRAKDEVTPAGAAGLLGVTRQFVDRLCEDGVLAFRRLPLAAELAEKIARAGAPRSAERFRPHVSARE